ncbi:hypothetical protein OG874_21550 [Nocardia sp. NBC_00565]|uniref:hypothetical protein n=1 Tax=Nocardia sp. NBC_00565 TaxID=2975993 RepID=UPI002E80F24A|nr:hypothetical protein [Nocardia sp. NBC_00565]WUC08365.1 hypothetical protein OG874_21550 [Nocardia sp. NBC_00565]
MVQLREGLRLDAVVVGNLDRDQSLHRLLPSQIHLGEGAGPDPHQKVEIVDTVADINGVENHLGTWASNHRAAVIARDSGELGADLYGGDITERGSGIGGVSTAHGVEFLVDQIGWKRTIFQLRKFRTVFDQSFGKVMTKPTVFEIDFDQFDQYRAPLSRFTGEVR